MMSPIGKSRDDVRPVSGPKAASTSSSCLEGTNCVGSSPQLLSAYQKKKERDEYEYEINKRNKKFKGNKIETNVDNVRTPEEKPYSPYILLEEKLEEAKTGGTPLNSLSIFTIHKTLKKLEFCPVNSVTRGRNSLTIHVSAALDSFRLLQSEQFAGIPVTASPHPKLNYSKGVVKHREFRNCSEEEMEEIPHVVEAVQIRIKKQGELIKTNTWILEFDTPKCPPTIDVCYIKNIDVQPYVPKPMRCFRCQRFGHTKKRCRARNPICPQCGQQEDHEGCDKAAWCPNCRQSGHTASSKNCQKFIDTQKILQHVAENGGTFAAARDVLFPKKKTYSDAVKGAPNRNQQSIPRRDNQQSRVPANRRGASPPSPTAPQLSPIHARNEKIKPHPQGLNPSDGGTPGRNRDQTLVSDIAVPLFPPGGSYARALSLTPTLPNPSKERINTSQRSYGLSSADSSGEEIMDCSYGRTQNGALKKLPLTSRHKVIAPTIHKKRNNPSENKSHLWLP